ncbi:Wadjet anti-phage system protein JetD domain-containing protein [Photobacterium swingsii]|uniref:Wadjet anti-phage system protein JetD domain-containing protein n=1 Tax=Photobacterium swingsii TaxID=680026 RepID=UPI00354F0C2A
MNVNDYLSKIEEGLPINLKGFIEKLSLKDPEQWMSIYKAKRVSKEHVLKVLDEERHTSFYTKDISSRTDGAKQGKSHAINTSFSHILLLNTTSFPNTPYVIVSSEGGVISSLPKLNDQAVVIENIENFYRYMSFMESIGREELIEHTDFLFGAGTQINNSLNLKFLTNYKRIYVAGDLDLGGLKIFRTLAMNVSDCHWLSPVDWGKFEAFFNLKPKSVSEWRQAISIASELNLEQEKQLLHTHRAFLEQEALLP